jgi:hypothetical protein
MILFQLKRLVIVSFFFGGGAWFEHRLGIVPAMLCMCTIALGLCAATAMMLHRATPGRVSVANRIAPIILPIGIHLGRGKLWPMVAWSTAGWAMIALAGALCGKFGFAFASSPATRGNAGEFFRAAFIIGVILDALGLGYLLNLWAKIRARGSSNLKAIFPLFLILLCAIGSGFIFSWKGWPTMAAMIACAPPVLVGGFYGLFMQMVLIFKPRWN